MKATAIEITGEVHTFSYECEDAAEAFGAMAEWWGKLVYGIIPNREIIKLECDPDEVILPFFGTAKLSAFFMDKHTPVNFRDFVGE